ncbi:MAG: DinB family protein [Gemmatimonadales bacterium]
MLPALEYYARLLRYDAWANAETLGSLRQGEAPARALRWMGHIIGAGALWLARLREEPAPMAVWPELDLEQCAAGIALLSESWPRYLETLAPADLHEGIGYRNSLGEYWTNSAGDILTHVAMHGAYHRAQIAASVREHGGAPAYTDFIHAVRQRLVE